MLSAGREQHEKELLRWSEPRDHSGTDHKILQLETLCRGNGIHRRPVAGQPRAMSRRSQDAISVSQRPWRLLTLQPPRRDVQLMSRMLAICETPSLCHKLWTCRSFAFLKCGKAKSLRWQRGRSPAHSSTNARSRLSG